MRVRVSESESENESESESLVGGCRRGCRRDGEGEMRGRDVCERDVRDV